MCPFQYISADNILDFKIYFSRLQSGMVQVGMHNLWESKNPYFSKPKSHWQPYYPSNDARSAFIQATLAAVAFASCTAFSGSFWKESNFILDVYFVTHFQNSTSSWWGAADWEIRFRTFHFSTFFSLFSQIISTLNIQQGVSVSFQTNPIDAQLLSASWQIKWATLTFLLRLLTPLPATKQNHAPWEPLQPLSYTLHMQCPTSISSINVASLFVSALATCIKILFS